MRYCQFCYRVNVPLVFNPGCEPLGFEPGWECSEEDDLEECGRILWARAGLDQSG